MNTPLTPEQAEGILDSWIQNGYGALRDFSGDELREHVHFTGGCLFGQLTALGYDYAAAQRMVRRYFLAIQHAYAETQHAMSDEKRSLN